MLNINLADAGIGQIKIKTPKRMYGTVHKIQLFVPEKISMVLKRLRTCDALPYFIKKGCGPVFHYSTVWRRSLNLLPACELTESLPAAFLSNKSLPAPFLSACRLSTCCLSERNPPAYRLFPAGCLPSTCLHSPPPHTALPAFLSYYLCLCVRLMLVPASLHAADVPKIQSFCLSFTLGPKIHQHFKSCWQFNIHK
jgi:hypothetical protein